jgi:hypothetical protein
LATVQHLVMVPGFIFAYPSLFKAQAQGFFELEQSITSSVSLCQFQLSKRVRVLYSVI